MYVQTLHVQCIYSIVYKDIIHNNKIKDNIVILPIYLYAINMHIYT